MVSAYGAVVSSIAWLDRCVPCNPHVTLRAIDVEWEQKAQPKGNERKRKSCEARPDSTNPMNSQQEKKAEEDDDCGYEKQNNI